MPSPLISDPQQVLKKHWGYPAFRPLQREIVESVLQGRDTLGLMPTGGGKSITFQVPALMMEGAAIVVSPLISLMKDQVDNLRRRRIKAVFFHSGMSARENRLAWEKLFKGGAKFLYVSPEKLKNPRFLQEINRLKVCLTVVDEAHCISQWGYDFRPSYLNIATLRGYTHGAPVLALTATATPVVAADICRQLKMTKPACFRMSFSRSNLSYIVRPAPMKIHEVFHILSRTSGCGIVYVRSRKRTREISDYLNSCGISATFYHAGLEYALKEKRQNQWQSGEVRVMVATNAFGMGIDKPDVRTVVHYDMPPSLEEYYQEAGRAGRDGLHSFAVLLTSPSDPATLRRRVTEIFPPREYIRKVYERICVANHLAVGEGYEKTAEFDIERFCQTFQYQERQCRAAVRLLCQAGYLEYNEDPDQRSRVIIICTREDLYHLPGLSPEADKVLHKILRLYPGLFTDYVYINEVTISEETRLSYAQVYDAFLELARAKVVHYVPKSRMPSIYFPTAREDTDHVMIGKAIYEERRQIIAQRVEAMIQYAGSTSRCRENMLLSYFGETRDSHCRRCDVCRAAAPASMPDAEAPHPTERVVECLEQCPHGADVNTIRQRTGLDGKVLREALAFLCDENLITFNGHAYEIRS